MRAAEVLDLESPGRISPPHQQVCTVKLVIGILTAL